MGWTKCEQTDMHIDEHTDEMIPIYPQTLFVTQTDGVIPIYHVYTQNFVWRGGGYENSSSSKWLEYGYILYIKRLVFWYHCFIISICLVLSSFQF